MMLAYYVVSMLMFAGLTFIWSSQFGLNLLIKLAFFGMTVWSIVNVVRSAV